MEITDEVKNALKILSLRSLLRDAFKEFTRPIEERDLEKLNSVNFHDITDAVIACSGISMSESISIITIYFEDALKKLK